MKSKAQAAHHGRHRCLVGSPLLGNEQYLDIDRVGRIYGRADLRATFLPISRNVCLGLARNRVAVAGAGIVCFIQYFCPSAYASFSPIPAFAQARRASPEGAPQAKGYFAGDKTPRVSTEQIAVFSPTLSRQVREAASVTR